MLPLRQSACVWLVVLILKVNMMGTPLNVLPVTSALSATSAPHSPQWAPSRVGGVSVWSRENHVIAEMLMRVRAVASIRRLWSVQNTLRARRMHALMHCARRTTGVPSVSFVIMVAAGIYGTVVRSVPLMDGRSSVQLCGGCVCLSGCCFLCGLHAAMRTGRARSLPAP